MEESAELSCDKLPDLPAGLEMWEELKDLEDNMMHRKNLESSITEFRILEK